MNPILFSYHLFLFGTFTLHRSQKLATAKKPYRNLKNGVAIYEVLCVFVHDAVGSVGFWQLVVYGLVSVQEMENSIHILSENIFSFKVEIQ